MSGYKIELKKGEKFSLKPPPRHYRIVWEPAEPDYTLNHLPKHKPKYSVTTDWSKYIKESMI